jgi:fructosamine-3-kinase
VSDSWRSKKGSVPFSVRDALVAATGVRLHAHPAADVGGGSINHSLRWDGHEASLFVKLAPAGRLAMLEAEADGLRELEATRTIRVPEVLGCGAVESHAFLALEWIDFAPPGARSDARLGELLAAQHRVTAPRYGWHRDNTIGSTPQRNDWDDDWPSFYVQRRLEIQFDLAARNGHGARLKDRGQELCGCIRTFFAGYRPEPSLLHGDLWSGNRAATRAGEPVIFDPAVYFGDREADIAMTRLFGGFGRDFYAAYLSAWPLADGAETRCGLYNLYHVLNHLNLFGGGYGAQALHMIEELIVAASG